MIDHSKEQLLPAPKVLARYGISQMALWRWERRVELAFPQPVRIARRRYYRLSELLEFEQRHARKAA